jgi:alanyl-tRNA synthetase
MKARQLKEKFVQFFVDKQHQEIPPVSLIPQNDSSTLFISAGMHPLVPYLMGQKHPLGKRLVNIQKCIRTSDIEKVGNATHHTFFEMLGNWSLNDYFKKEMIPWSFEFLTQVLNYDPKILNVTVYKDDKESLEIWKSLGISDDRIRILDKEDNWWERGGVDGPCGPDTEMFIPDKDGNLVEIWNDVFMDQYNDGQGNYRDLGYKNVDTGMGLERNIAMLEGLDDNYLTDIWQPIIKKIEQLSGKKYNDDKKSFRIIADHIKASVFIIADGVEPANKEAGYVLRRLIRKSLRVAKNFNIDTLVPIAQAVIDNQDNYGGKYEELNNPNILKVIRDEEIKFQKTLELGLKELQKYDQISGFDAFKIYETFGFPLELIEEEISKKINLTEFEQAKAEHQSKSKTIKVGQFKSGLENSSEIITKYHTATHLLHAALRKILGDNVHQCGSNITAERLRFDFTYPQKLTFEQIQDIQTLVNQKIQENIPLTSQNMKFETAQKNGALAFFGNKYPEIVSVYTCGDFSKEVCTGPHVNHTGELGKFKITKEESAGSGKRRIYAILN